MIQMRTVRLGREPRSTVVRLTESGKNYFKLVERTPLSTVIYIHFVKSKLTESQFGEKMGVQKKMVNHYLHRMQTIQYRVVQRIAEVLDCDPALFASYVPKKRGQAKGKLGILIRAHRIKQCLSLDMLAEKVRCTRQFIDQIEKGISSMSNSHELLRRFVEILKIDPALIESMQPTRRITRKKRNTHLGKFLTRQRIKLNLSQEEVARVCGIPSSTFSFMETGTRIPNRDDVVLVLKFLLKGSAPKSIPRAVKKFLVKNPRDTRTVVRRPPSRIGRYGVKGDRVRDNMALPT